MFHDAVARLEASGVIVERVAPPFDLDLVLRHHRTIMAFDAAQVHAIAFTNNPDAYGRQITSLLREGLAMSSDEYGAALDFQKQFTADADNFLAGYDAVLTPATPTVAPPRRDTTGDPSFNVPWSLAGVPAIALPCALDEAGMPAALQLACPRGQMTGALESGRLVRGATRFHGPPTACIRNLLAESRDHSP